MIIAGERDRENEVMNEGNNKRWDNAGIYDQETGFFYIREGEHFGIQKHFKPLRTNWMSQKKTVNNFLHKSKPADPSFKPVINTKSSNYANQRRQKLFNAPH